MTKILAALLTVGGFFGAVLSASNSYAVVRAHPGAGAALFAYALLFIFSVLTGIRLWRGDPRGVKWAAILFALQISVITLRHFDYEFFTGVSVKIMHAEGIWDTNSAVGSSLNLMFYELPTSPRFGINVIALLALVFLAATNTTSRVEGFNTTRAGANRRRFSNYK